MAARLFDFWGQSDWVHVLASVLTICQNLGVFLAFKWDDVLIYQVGLL